MFAENITLLRLRPRAALYAFIVFYAIGLTFYVALTNLNSVMVRNHLADCGYVSHPIADVAWELYANHGGHIGAAGYFSIMANSKNIPAVKCLKKRLPGQWELF